jgi:predicted metal-dependent hydrolase
MVVAGIEVELVQKNIKNLHLAVYPPHGRVRLAAPLDVNKKTLELYLISKLPWIRRQQRLFSKQNREPQRQYVTRESHYFLGKRYLLRVHDTDAPACIKLKTKTYIDMHVPANSSVDYRKELLSEWYRHELYKIVDEMLPRWEKKLGVKPNRITVRNMKTKWGSCNTDTGNILLNLELVKKPMQHIEYVLVHEMAHLIERKHNDTFAAIVEKHIPKWKHLRDELNRMPVGYVEW